MKTIYRDTTLAFGTWNTHVGIALEQGGMAWLRRKAPAVKAWMLQEVRDHQRDELRNQLGRGWVIHPGPGHDRDGALPYVAYYAPTFDWQWGVVDEMAGAYPRARVAASLLHPRSGRTVILSSVHVDPLGKGFVRADPQARERHMRQIQQYADAVKSRPPGSVVVDGGDFNEDLDVRVLGDLAPDSAIARFRRAGSRPAHQLARWGNKQADLDDIFFRVEDYVSVRRRRVLLPPQRGGDHPAVVTRVRVKAAR